MCMNVLCRSNVLCTVHQCVLIVHQCVLIVHQCVVYGRIYICHHVLQTPTSHTIICPTTHAPGGTSLDAMHVAALLQLQSVQVLMQHSTPRRLAQALRGVVHDKNVADTNAAGTLDDTLVPETLDAPVRVCVCLPTAPEYVDLTMYRPHHVLTSPSLDLTMSNLCTQCPCTCCCLFTFQKPPPPHTPQRPQTSHKPTVHIDHTTAHPRRATPITTPPLACPDERMCGWPTCGIRSNSTP